MKSFVGGIRNKIESSSFALSMLNLLTGNWIYKKYVWNLFRKKVDDIEKNKKYYFAIESTSFCNAKCSFCPNCKMKRQKQVMGMEVFLKIVERIKQEKIRPVVFNLAGTGEPLIDKNIFKKINVLKKSFPEAELFMPTNLNLANEEIQERLVNGGLDNISVSLNADNVADYKKIMSLDFKVTIKNLEGLIRLRNKYKSKLKINIKLAANPVNKHSIKKFLKRWEKKVDSVGVSWIHSWAGAVDNGDKKNKYLVRYPCRSLFEQIVIHANGNIALCCVDYEGEAVGGNVMRDEIIGAFNGLKIKKIKEMHRAGKIDQIKMCSNCRFSERGLYWLVE